MKYDALDRYLSSLMASIASESVFIKGDCAICTDAFNKTTRKAIVCGSCAHVSCMACTKTYLLQSVHQPHCMNCRKEWSPEFMNQVLPDSFMKKEYRAMRETILFEEEKTHLPPLQAEAERQLLLEQYEKQMTECVAEKWKNDANEDQLVSSQRAIERELNTKLEKLRVLCSKLLHKDLITEKKTFLMPCPMNECRGFLSTAYKCGICATHVCKECHREKTEVHECLPDEVATITELKQNTKPCPKCYVPIFKTDGCDQMFCISCHTAFSWRTGQMETGVIHNPHYFEALRAGNIQDPRHRQDHGGCGPMPAYRDIFRMLRNYMMSPVQDEIDGLYQQMAHHRAVTLVQLAHREDRSADRIAYLMGKLDEKKFKQRAFVSHQKGIRMIEERQIMDSYVTIGEELFRTLTVDSLPTVLEQFRTLKTVTHEAIVSLDKKFQHKGLVRPTDIIRV